MKMRFPYSPFVPYRPYNDKPYQMEHIDRRKNYKCIPPAKTQNTSAKCESNEPFIEIMGIKLDFDDFLILGLLFFLYMEDNDDQMLYIILIILLLT